MLPICRRPTRFRMRRTIPFAADKKSSRASSIPLTWHRASAGRPTSCHPRSGPPPHPQPVEGACPASPMAPALEGSRSPTPSKNRSIIPQPVQVLAIAAFFASARNFCRLPKNYIILKSPYNSSIVGLGHGSAVRRSCSQYVYYRNKCQDAQIGRAHV